MLYCPRCQAAFEDKELIKCFYCNGTLFKRNIFQAAADKKISIEDRELLTHEHKSYLLGSFFRSKIFLTSFIFSLNDMKEGKAKKRFWVQPLNISFLIKLPWLLINFFSSIAFPFLFQGYCDKCKTKYIHIFREGSHSDDDCEYNQEYNRIVQNLFSGKIVIRIKPLEEEALERKKRGKRSAYFDLMDRNVTLGKFLDILAILATIVFYVFLIASIAMPILGRIYDF